MAEDVTKNFTGWIDEHYRMGLATESGTKYFCRRCGIEVNYMTKHAADRHGDDIEVIPVIDGYPHELKW